MHLPNISVHHHRRVNLVRHTSFHSETMHYVRLQEPQVETPQNSAILRFNRVVKPSDVFDSASLPLINFCRSCVCVAYLK
jgi:hypothetical protein